MRTKTPDSLMKKGGLTVTMKTARLLMLQALCCYRAGALYISYEDATSYDFGERIPVIANKLTSPTALAVMDYSHMSICDESVGVVDAKRNSKWHGAMKALHGDAWRASTMEVSAGQDVYCGTLCTVLAEGDRLEAVRRDFSYHFAIDGLPAAFLLEDDETKTTRYWGGIPVGRRGVGDAVSTDSSYQGTLESEIFLYNHFNLNIAYSSKNGKYQIIRFWVQPFSIHHEEAVNLTSCQAGSTSHINYNQLVGNAPVQPGVGLVKYTYDVHWVEVDPDLISYRDRWDIYLTMDDATPAYIEFAGVFLGAFLLVVLVGTLYTWVMRDLSYKPVVSQADFDNEQEILEVQMWPLSTRVFFPPVSSPVLLCAACGTGAHLLTSGFWFVVLFRTGIISQSQGADILTPGAILFVLSSPVAGYVTGRLFAIFHGEIAIALAASLATAIAYPLLGMLVLYLVYDVLPDELSPHYNVLAHMQPLILLWIFIVWPSSVAGGFVGFRHGPVQNFPVSSGTAGYHDLNLQDEGQDNSKENEEWKVGKLASCLRRYRIVFLFLTCGLLPVLSCFVNYSYGVAAPILIGSYSVRAYMIISFVLFIFVAAAVSVLMYYRQIRVHNFRWWWSSFFAGGSSGLYIFFLSMSWLLSKADSHIPGNDMALYTLWFAFLSLGVTLINGFAGVAACIWFNRTLYTAIMRRQ